MDETITKRLHISGLTSALTANDLSKRLSTFGTVKAVDGFGLSDGLGQPRKFGYVTLETTPGKLARCLNLLSGSTWKGAKLRIGEAKPDLAERLATERQAAAEEPPKKRRRCAGVEAPDMSLVTTENVAGRGGWKVTPLGRIVRPVRMRPEHPLPPPKEDKEKRLKKKGEDGKKKKQRVKEPDVRARRRTIDVTRWGSVHLKGMFLDIEVLGTRRDLGEVKEPEPEVEVESEGSGSGSGSEIDADVPREEIEVEEAVGEDVEEAPPLTETVAETSTPPPPAKPTPMTTILTPKMLPDDPTNFAAEKTQSLNLLASLFGNKADNDWVGRESVGSDIDEDEIARRHQMAIDADDSGDFEVVPMDADTVDMQLDQDGDEAEDPDQGTEAGVEEAPAPAPPPPPQTQKQQQATKLKDLFAPREEDAGFSLLGHLDLDLELDDEVPFAIASAMAEPTYEPTPTSAPSFAFPTTTSTAAHPQLLHLNPKQPLFFPLPALPAGSTKARPKDILDAAKEGGWSWRNPSVGFFRTGTEEDIRKRWEESRGELTREWKKRWREAGKARRRRGRGGDGNGAEGGGE